MVINFWKNPEHQELVPLLRAIPGFENLSNRNVYKIIAQAEFRNVVRGERLIREGDEADVLYFVYRGRFVVHAGNTPVAEIVAGESIGEIAFFTGAKRTASVFAARTSGVLSLTRDAFDQLTKEIPELSQNIILTLAKRVADTTKQTTRMRLKAPKIAALIGLGEDALPGDLSAQIAMELAALGEWDIVSLYDLPDDEGSEELALGDKVAHAEFGSDNLLLICPGGEQNSELVNMVIENSDCIFLFARGSDGHNGPVPLNALEDTLFSSQVQATIHLVLWRKHYEEEIRSTANWLENRDIHMHHHLALDRPNDAKRVARFIAGKALGLVLGGGGALGTAHLGMIKALHEHGIEIDILGGTSVGAAMAGAIAAGHTPDEAMRRTDDIFITNKAMGRWGLPLFSFLNDKNFDTQLMKHYGDVQIEDLPFNYFALAASLTTNDVQVMRRGSLFGAVRSSAAIPAVLPPYVTENGEVLIDGSLMDNVPVNTMRQLKLGSNIVCSFDNNQAWFVRERNQELPGQFGILARMLGLKRSKRLRGKFPNIAQVLMRTMVINSRRHMTNVQKEGDIFINLRPTPGMSFISWHKGQKQFDAAYNEISQAFRDVSTRVNLEGQPTEEKLLLLEARFNEIQEKQNAKKTKTAETSS